MSGKANGVKRLLVATLTGILLGLLATVAGASETPQFASYDAHRLLGSPHPLPLRTEIAFPNLTFQRPVELTYAGDGTNRLFVAEQQGRIHVFPNRADARSTKLFLDIHEVVSRDGNEEGLLGLAFHPNYQANGRFYVYYSTRPRASVISEFQVSEEDPDRADRASERILLKFKQPFSNHNGGSIKFGPDGFLYVGLGDGGAANDPFGNGQNLKTLLGSILRIDVNHRDPGMAYAIPEDNPFADRGDAARGEIWAYGIRNAWRLSFDRKTGQLWTGDVGQNRYEEVDRIVRGGNYGWNLREGFHPFQTGGIVPPSGLRQPLTEYFRQEGVSVTGGLVYRGQRLAGYQGAYFYGDYVSGNVWILRVDGNDHVTLNRKVASTGLNIAAFGDDASGELYLCAFDGHIHQFVQRTEDLEAIAKQFPRKLSETGLYADTRADQPADCMVPYDVNVPLWSDGATKRRFFTLPRGQSIIFHPHAAWEFPVGAVLVKSFYLPVVVKEPAGTRRARGAAAPLRRLETRLLVHTIDGWRGYTYVWNQQQTDAELLENAQTIQYQVDSGDSVHPQDWYYPNQSDCMACHTQSARFVLGPRTRQLNRAAVDAPSINQIDRFRHLNLFRDPVPPAADQLDAYPDWRAAATAPADRMARAYLDTTCAMCHAPDGIVRAPDLRFDTPLAQMRLIDRPAGQGSIGPRDAKIVAPGAPMQSELMHRIGRRGPRQMPPLATSQTDLKAVRIIMQWIESLPDRH